MGAFVNQKRLIMGISISSLLILIISGVVLFKGWQSKQAQVDQRFPLQRLSYCNSDQVTPCIVSFSMDSNGKMVVNFLTTGAFYPDFYLKINQEGDDHIYTCQKANKFATNVYCTGATMPFGEVLQFSIFSLKENVLLAEGNFAIIGMGLGTPEIFSSPTLDTSLTSSPTEEGLKTPTPPLSYPNTSYPNPSHP